MLRRALSRMAAGRGRIDDTEIVFVTGNANKLREVQRILGDGFPFPITSRKVDLPELQGDPMDVAREKARTASEKIVAPVLVEDTSLCYNALNGLPGVYIKWFLEKLGHDGLNKIIEGYEDKTAYAQCIFAFCPHPGAEVSLFVGRTDGKIVPPRGPLDFGWDPVFEPTEGQGKTFAEMSKDEKDAISHRGRALRSVSEGLAARAQEIADAVDEAARKRTRGGPKLEL